MKTFITILILFMINTLIISQPQHILGSFVFEGSLRNYEMYLPQNYVPNMPVVFALHGYSETIPWFKDYTLMNEFADTAGFIVVFPAGSFASNGIVGWNNGLRNHPLGRTDTTANDVGFISALIDTITENYSIDESRIYCCGFSMGGDMSYRLAIELGHRFAAIAPVAGKLNGVTGNLGYPIKTIPVAHIHGTEDNVELYGPGWGNLWSVDETISFWVQNNNCTGFTTTVTLPDIDTTDNCYVQKHTYKDLSDEIQIILYKVINGGHSWPGSTFTFATEGNKNQDINASHEIWNFFKNYQNPLTDLAFTKACHTQPKFLDLQLTDTLKIITETSNPANHQVTIQASIKGKYSTFSDSLILLDDGINDNGIAGDNIFGGIKAYTSFSMPFEDYYDVNIYTTDVDEQITTYLKFTKCFTNAGPIKIEHYEEITLSNNRIGLKNFTLKNYSSSLTVEDIVGKLKTSDSRVTEIIKGTQSFGAIAAGESKVIPSAFSFSVDSNTSVNEIEFELEITSNGIVYWNDLDFTVTELDDDNNMLPDEFSLSQNYPNPFNPSTSIKYSIPKRNTVKLKIFDVLGNEIAVLVDEEKPVGDYEVEFDASKFSSGVYFYKLQAGDFVESKKMVLLK